MHAANVSSVHYGVASVHANEIKSELLPYERFVESLRRVRPGEIYAQAFDGHIDRIASAVRSACRNAGIGDEHARDMLAVVDFHAANMRLALGLPSARTAGRGHY